MTDFMDDYRRRAANAGAACGPRCPGNRIPLTPYEVARIAAALGLTTGEVIHRYLQDGSSLLAVKEDGTCVFHRTQGCDVHQGRPMSCRSFADPADGSSRYLERARQYRRILRRWVATDDSDAADGDTDSGSERTVPHPAPEIGVWILDVDSMVADRCRERGVPVPMDLEARIDVHLEALRAVLE
jgi:Fe-S-cluster containining protein